MAIRGCKSIAEFAFRRWMAENGFVGGYFTLDVVGNEGIIEDRTGATLRLSYDSAERCVQVEGEGVTG